MRGDWATRAALSAAVITAAALYASSAPAQADILAPGPQLTLPASHGTVRQPVFQWSAVPTAGAYELEIAYDHRFTNPWLRTTTPANRYIPTNSLPASSYWWRVRTLDPRSRWSVPRSFTLHWESRGELARPNHVSVDDFLPESPGEQVPINAQKIWWDPVDNASGYEVQFDGEPDSVCVTVHTVLTLGSSANVAESGPIGGEACSVELAQGPHWVRVRALDATTSEGTRYSVWSDEARHVKEEPPAETAFEITAPWTVSEAPGPAQLTNPVNDQVVLDAPVLQWNPVVQALRYRVLIARDKDFTSLVGEWETTNTRLLPPDPIWDETPMRAYYWTVLPCFDDVRCLNENQAVNRPGRFGVFKKQSLEVTTTPPSRNASPWTTFHWEPLDKTVDQVQGRARPDLISVPCVSWYEVQYRYVGAPWATATTRATDLVSLLDVGLPFGHDFLWRVRVVDGTDQFGTWSEARRATTPDAAPRAPKRVRVRRVDDVVFISWSPAKFRYFRVTGYDVWWSKNGHAWKRLQSTFGTDVVLKSPRHLRYRARITAHNSAGESRPSAQVRVR